MPEGGLYILCIIWGRFVEKIQVDVIGGLVPFV